MKKHRLPTFEEWDDFDRIVSVLTHSLGWTIGAEKVDGADARACSFNKQDLHLWLVFDDIMGMELKCEGDSAHLEKVGDAILAIMNYDGGPK